MTKIFEWAGQNRNFMIAIALAALLYLLYSNEGLGLVAASLTLVSIALLICIQQYKYEKTYRLILHRIAPVSASCRELINFISINKTYGLTLKFACIDVKSDIDDFRSYGNFTSGMLINLPVNLMIEIDKAKILMSRVKEFVDDVTDHADNDEIIGLRSWLEKLLASLTAIETYTA